VPELLSRPAHGVEAPHRGVEATPERQPRPPGGDLVIALLFTITTFVGAGLLFSVQPMISKLLLPSYGGSATVWSSSSLFFQLLLLLGYLYTHLATTRFGPRWQPRLHVLLLLCPLAVLPVVLPTSAAPDAGTSPTLWLLRTLALMIGLPFLVLATSGPLIQRWYSWTGAVRAEDPYFLFAASNLGSFGALLAYPFLIEPQLTLAQQRNWWSAGFLVFAVLATACGLLASRRGGARATAAVDASSTARPQPRPSVRTMFSWVWLAFLPSGFMLAVTAHISTDVAAIPLLWVVPLAIYLATFVVAFSRSTRNRPVALTRVAVAATVVTALVSATTQTLPIVVLVTLNLIPLALVGYCAHARLAADRPSPEHLTAFYLVIAVGGAMGGVLNGFVAPLAFDAVWEFPLVLACVPLLLLGQQAGRDSWFSQRHHPVFVGVLVCVILLTGYLPAVSLMKLATSSGPLFFALALLAATAIGLWASRHPVALSLTLVAGFLVTAVVSESSTLVQERTFYGSYAVSSGHGLHRLTHGTTLHGTQFQDAARRGLPTTYYAADGPVGDFMAGADARRVGIVGLGVGTLAAYGAPGQSMTFFEIDPDIARIAADPSLFSYVSDSRADVTIRVGDGRLLMAGEPERSFDLVALDAFSSDSIPVHLLTREAFALFASRVARGGTFAVHVSNRIVNLEPVLSAAAKELNWVGAVGEGGDGPGATTSTWVVLSADRARIQSLLNKRGWRGLESSRQVQWTDDYSSILSVLR
jgi:hypothetical protein